MKKIPSFLICTLLIATITHPSRVSAADSNILYYFDKPDSGMPTNSGGASFSIGYVGTTQQTSTEHKFGGGSMKIGEKGIVPNVAEFTGFASKPDEFNDAISKLTIVAWIRPTSPPPGGQSKFSGDGGSHIFGRWVNGKGPGFFFYDFSYKRFNFTFYCDTADPKLQSYSSPAILGALTDEWLQVAVTFDEGHIVFYYNGLPIGDANAATKGGTSISAVEASSTLVGFSFSNPGDCIDDFGFFPGRALSDPEIDEIYTKGLEAFTKASIPAPTPGKSPAAKPGAASLPIRK
ncbi:MAG: LamG-like jellyroll fold domain-containing protein [Chthoniobacterales bacterium]